MWKEGGELEGRIPCHALRCRSHHTTQHIVDNFAYLLETYGHIPNGIRTYYLNRRRVQGAGARTSAKSAGPPCSLVLASCFCRGPLHACGHRWQVQHSPLSNGAAGYDSRHAAAP